MSTRSPDLDEVGEAAERLSVGTRRWMGTHAGYLDSPAAHAELPVTARVKALLQLGLLCHYWGRAIPGEAALGDAVAVVDRAWRRPDFPLPSGFDQRKARHFQLLYAALAPAGTATDEHRELLARLAADGYLAPGRKSPYLHLGVRFFADLAGVGHRLASYQELYESSLLARAATMPVAELDVCEVTDTVFYLSDFGFRDPGLTEESREQALRVVDRLMDRCARDGAWEYAGKLVLAQACLGMDPLRTPSGAAGIRMLAHAQAQDGAIPGKTSAGRAPETATPEEYFRKAYQATLVTALVMTIITAGRADGLATAGPSAARRAL
ncbi:DUF6895 family protein [Streptomyces sp. NPDC057271]|uniref:DUF6895 family protein n=1 Tax=unclassified Streptomyces TaxID=2593676 RepID=UPI00364110BF